MRGHIIGALIMAAAIFPAIGQAQTVTVDGFTVTVATPPARAKVQVSSNVVGTVRYLTGAVDNVGASPYFGTKGDHPAYLSVAQNSYAEFKSAQPVTTISILWGTIGPMDSIRFYSVAGSKGSLIGTLRGADLSSALNASNQNRYLTIESSTPFRMIQVAEGQSCCFEFADVSAQ